MPPLPLSLLSTTDGVLRDLAVFGAVVDTPGLVVLRYDIADDADGGSVRRLVMDVNGVVEDVTIPLEHACLSCAVRDDAVPTLARIADALRWSAVMLALPVSAETFPVAQALGQATQRGGELRGLRLAPVVCAVSMDGLEHDLLGDDLLAERGLQLTDDDRRAVGEALAAQLAHADVVVTTGENGSARALDLLDHVRAWDGHRVDGLHRLKLTALLAQRHDPRRGELRMDPLAVEPAAAPTGNGAWTLDLRSARPFHPERLFDQVERLGSGQLRSRGRFWVPTRPDTVCGWDGAGGQLSVGEVGGWGHRRPSTRLVVTGTGPERADLAAAFDELLLSDREMASGLAPWLGVDDVLAPWLGDRSAAA